MRNPNKLCIYVHPYLKSEAPDLDTHIASMCGTYCYLLMTHKQLPIMKEASLFSSFQKFSSECFGSFRRYLSSKLESWTCLVTFQIMAEKTNVNVVINIEKILQTNIIHIQMYVNCNNFSYYIKTVNVRFLFFSSKLHLKEKFPWLIARRASNISALGTTNELCKICNVILISIKNNDMK